MERLIARVDGIANLGDLALIAWAGHAAGCATDRVWNANPRARSGRQIASRRSKWRGRFLPRPSTRRQTAPARRRRAPRRAAAAGLRARRRPVSRITSAITRRASGATCPASPTSCTRRSRSRSSGSPAATTTRFDALRSAPSRCAGTRGPPGNGGGTSTTAPAACSKATLSTPSIRRRWRRWPCSPPRTRHDTNYDDSHRQRPRLAVERARARRRVARSIAAKVSSGAKSRAANQPSSRATCRRPSRASRPTCARRALFPADGDRLRGPSRIISAGCCTPGRPCRRASAAPERHA